MNKKAIHCLSLAMGFSAAPGLDRKDPSADKAKELKQQVEAAMSEELDLGIFDLSLFNQFREDQGFDPHD